MMNILNKNALKNKIKNSQQKVNIYNPNRNMDKKLLISAHNL